jgi:GTPase SAR1 family protein
MASPVVAHKVCFIQYGKGAGIFSLLAGYDRHAPPVTETQINKRSVKIGESEVVLKCWQLVEQDHSNWSLYLPGAEAVCFCFDLTDKFEMNGLETMMDSKIMHESLERNIVRMLVGLKSDLAEKREVSLEDGQNFAQKHGMAYWEVSALKNTNVERFYKDLAIKVTERASRLEAIQPLAAKS